MKIVFDSEEERKSFIAKNCPNKIGLPYYCAGGVGCDVCWERAVKIEVEEQEEKEDDKCPFSNVLKKDGEDCGIMAFCEDCSWWKEKMKDGDEK